MMDVAVVASPESQPGACQDMPRDLKMGIEFAKNKPVDLVLKLNKNKNEQRNVYVPRTDILNRKQKLVKENVAIKRVSVS